MQFEYFVERLDEADQLDALHALANIYISLHRWSKVNILAEEMERKASIQYQNQYLVTKQRETRKEPKKTNLLLHPLRLSAPFGGMP